MHAVVVAARRLVCAYINVSTLCGSNAAGGVVCGAASLELWKSSRINNSTAGMAAWPGDEIW